MRHTIKDQEHKLSVATQKHEDSEREVSLWDEFFFAAITRTSLCLEYLGQDDK